MYLKSTRGAKTPDLLIRRQSEKLVIEISDRGRGREQFKGIHIDRKVVFADHETPGAGRLPLFLLGFLAELLFLFLGGTVASGSNEITQKEDTV